MIPTSGHQSLSCEKKTQYINLFKRRKANTKAAFWLLTQVLGKVKFCIHVVHNLTQGLMFALKLFLGAEYRKHIYNLKGTLSLNLQNASQSEI